MNIRRAVLLLVALCCPGGLALAQGAWDLHGRYTLSEVVVFSRHNLRSPLSTKGSVTPDVTAPVVVPLHFPSLPATLDALYPLADFLRLLAALK